MKREASYIIYIVCFFLLFLPFQMQADEDDVLNRKISLSQQNGTVYQMLEEITEHSGFLFIYDSKIIDNEKQTILKEKEYSIREAIYAITGNDTLQLEVIGNHILVSLPSNTDSADVQKSEIVLIHKDSSFFTATGIIRDNYSQEPISYGTVSVKESSIGTVTNQNGEFRLHLPDSLRQSTILFSHLGYEPKEISSELIKGQHTILTLEPKVIPIQEIVVRLVNPVKQIQEMMDSRNSNYAEKPVFLTTFYREGVEHGKTLVNLTEAIFKVHKTPFNSSQNSDQIKLLKMRRISNKHENDSLIAKMKSGISACLMLDVVKIVPDFFTFDAESLYNYAHTDITIIDNRLANVIFFEQKAETDYPLYKGEIYIDVENKALLRVRFEYNPKFIKKAGSMFVTKKSRGLTISPQKVSYTVSYKPLNGIYYINHVRGDLNFKIKKRRMFFNTSNLHTWFEMATCKTDTLQVKRFTKNEILSTRTVFAETDFKYDESFWEDFNVILPEEKLQEAIRKLSLKIEETDN